MYTGALESRRIVAGVDFSHGSFAAVRWVARWMASDAELILVHALVIPEFEGILASRYPLPQSLLENAKAGARRRLKEFSETLNHPRVICEIREGRPAQEIAEVAREYKADLVVVGKHGERPLPGYPGRTADTLVRSAPAPVLMASAPPFGAPSRIIVPLTFSSVTPFVIEWTRRLQQLSGAHIVVVHVVGSAVLSHVLSMSSIKNGITPTPTEVDEIFSEDRIAWERQLIDAGIPEDHLTAEVVFGEVSDAVLSAARSHGADMIVMGSHAGPVRRLLLGSAATAVMRSAEAPVLVVTEPEPSAKEKYFEMEEAVGVGDGMAVYSI